MPEVDINVIFVNNLKRLLQINNMTYKELAEKIGVKASSVSMWMTGNSLPRMGTLDKIADLFNVSVESLVTVETLEDKIVNYNLGNLPEILADYTQELGGFLYYNPRHKVLFDASMEVKPQDVNLAKEMLDRINGKTADQPHRNEQHDKPKSN